MPKWWHPSYSTALLEGQKKVTGEGSMALLEKRQKNCLVPTKDGALKVPGEGGMAGECQRLLYLVPTKYGAPQVPGEGGMAEECQGCYP
jgi:hypothetical protein